MARQFDSHAFGLLGSVLALRPVDNAQPQRGAQGQIYMRGGRLRFVDAAGTERVLTPQEVIGIYDSDVNTAGSSFGSAPFAGSITRVSAVNYVTNTTTATVLTLEINGSPVTIPTWQFGATDALGTVVAVAPTAANTVAQDDTIEVITNGGGAPAMPAQFYIEITAE